MSRSRRKGMLGALNEAEVRHLLARGWLGIDVAAIAGVRPCTVFNWLGQRGIKLRRGRCGRLTRDEVRARRRRGHSLRRIARAAGVASTWTVLWHVRDIVPPARPLAAVAVGDPQRVARLVAARAAGGSAPRERNTEAAAAVAALLRSARRAGRREWARKLRGRLRNERLGWGWRGRVRREATA